MLTLVCSYVSWYALCALQFKMRVPEQCNVVCRKVLTKEEAGLFKDRIDDDYRVFMYAPTDLLL